MTEQKRLVCDLDLLKSTLRYSVYPWWDSKRGCYLDSVCVHFIGCSHFQVKSIVSDACEFIRTHHRMRNANRHLDKDFIISVLEEVEKVSTEMTITDQSTFMAIEPSTTVMKGDRNCCNHKDTINQALQDAIDYIKCTMRFWVG